MMIVAEMSANHGGSVHTALEIVRAAAHSGADAIKFQTFNPEMMAIPDYMIPDGQWEGIDLRELYQKAHTPDEWLPELFFYARTQGLTPFTSVFDTGSLPFLEGLKCPMYKISSFDIINIDLVISVAALGKPLIMSTGMATSEEIENAVDSAKAVGNDDITLLHCVSSYPAAIDEMNLRTMEMLKSRYKVKVGLSDHSLGSTVAIAATALGATMIEKHLRIDGVKSLDDSFSMTPREFASMVSNCRTALDALGSPRFGLGESSNLRPSLYYACDLPAGSVIEYNHLKVSRPALGAHPGRIWDIIGTNTSHDVRENDPVNG